LTDGLLGQAVLMRRRARRVPPPRSGFAGFRFPPDVIMVADRWYLRYGLSYRDVEELLTERGVVVASCDATAANLWHMKIAGRTRSTRRRRSS